MPSGNKSHTKVPLITRVRITILKSTSDILVSLVPRNGARIRPVKRSDVGRVIGPLLDSIASTLLDVTRSTAIPPMKQHHREKLTETQVRAIRASGDPIKCLSAEFGISMGSVSEIRNRRYYRWVK